MSIVLIVKYLLIPIPLPLALASFPHERVKWPHSLKCELPFVFLWRVLRLQRRSHHGRNSSLAKNKILQIKIKLEIIVYEGRETPNRGNTLRNMSRIASNENTEKDYIATDKFEKFCQTFQNCHSWPTSFNNPLSPAPITPPVHSSTSQSTEWLLVFVSEAAKLRRPRGTF